jgi:hypothetical protein
MKKILHFLKIITSALFKMFMGALVGMALGMGLGKNSVLEKKKDNKTIESKK